jgi:hypothetical protein
MFSIITPGVSSVDSKVNTAVEFLFDVSDKDFKDADLRRYLISSRGLTTKQVDEALYIHNKQLRKKKVEYEEAFHTARRKPPNSPKTLTEFTLMRIKVGKSEQTHKNFHDKVESILSLLRPSKHEVGYILTVNFLKAELEYCKSLESMIDDYRKVLVKAAGAGRFQLSSAELLEMFQRMPQFLKFHNAFYTDLGADIGRMVVRLINFFRQYTEYMRECVSSVRVFREHSRDKRLYKCLEQIKCTSDSKRDIYDLFLAPINHILLYRDFFDKLYQWADGNHTDFRFLGKATRRLGRIAKYVELYKERIENACEFNRVLHFIGDQCDLLLSRRRFLRRGEIIRRTTGWKARNKRYIFFLFNDVLLWTTLKGELQNVVKLRKCRVLPSEAKIEPHRKFKVVVDELGKKRKVLLLEFESQPKRDDWFALLETIIAKRNFSRVDDFQLWDNPISGVTELEMEKYAPDPTSHAWIDVDSMDLKQNECSDTVLEHTEVDSGQAEQTSLWQIDSIGDFESEISEFDQDFYQQYDKYTEMAEYTVSTKRATLGYEKMDTYTEPVVNRWENSTLLESDQTSFARDTHDWGSIKLRPEEKSTREIKAQHCPKLSYSPFTGTNILRKAEEQLSSQAAIKLQHSSSLSFRLNDKLIIHPDAENYQIRLIDFVDLCEERV